MSKAMATGKSSESNENFLPYGFMQVICFGPLPFSLFTNVLEKKVKNVYQPNIPTVNFENKSGQGNCSGKPCTFKQCIV